MILSLTCDGWRVFWKKENGMRRFVWMTAVAVGISLGTAAGAAVPMQQGGGDLRVYFADVEGGQATLFVTPGGESLLVDTGWPGAGGRDADRIVALCKQAGVAKIDNLVVTHFHTDHVGGVPQLLAKIPVGRVIDHGDNTETNDPATLSGWAAYQKVLAEGHLTRLSVKAGDVLPVHGMRVEVVSANGEVIGKPLVGGGAGAMNPECATSPTKNAEGSENDRSIGMMITFGRLRILDLGDLTWAKERPLMCPVNKLGRVDVYIVSHHGMDRSGSPALVKAIAPRVAIMDNGAKKGGAASTYDQIEDSGKLEDLWQLHTAVGNDDDHNADDSRIANLEGVDAGHSLELVARRDGSFAVTNERTGETVRYKADALEGK